jgi:SPP1 gp7 family putative phage head morphogenesis protein
VALDFKNTKRVGLLAKLGRGHYSPELAARVRPAEPRIERAQYLKFVRAIFVLWRHKVADKFDLGRQDAPGDLLSVDWDALIDESGLPGMLDKIARSIAARNQNYFANIVRTNPPKIGSQADMISAFRRRNVDLIKNAGHDMVADLNTTLAEANARGARHEEIARTIQERTDVGESRAKLIARDQTLKYNSSVHTAQAAAAGVTEFTWSTSHDGAVRPTHAHLDGQRFRYDDPPVTNDDGDRNLPGEDYQCRCVAIPVIDLFDGIEDAPNEPL